jgi:hypothetical protein
VSAPQPRRCAASPCPDMAARRSRLCRPCRDLLAERLAALPLGLAGGSASASWSGVASPGALVAAQLAVLPLSGRSAVVSVARPEVGASTRERAAIRAVLATWAHVVVAERAVPRPARSVASLASFLHEHVDWLGAHPAAAEITAEIGALVSPSARVTVAGVAA